MLGVALAVLLVGAASVQRADFSGLYGGYVALALLTALCSLPVDTRPVAAGSVRRSSAA